MPPAKLTSTKRFAVRLSLVTGSTLATIIGAQNLAAIDHQTTATPDPTITSLQLQPGLTIAPSSFSGDPSSVAHAAPAITILRRPGQPGASTNSNVSIQPPAPVQIAAPAPVIVQAPSSPVVVQAPGAPAPAPRPATRSSRR